MTISISEFLDDESFDEWDNLRYIHEPKPSTIRQLAGLVIPDEDLPTMRSLLRREGCTSLNHLADKYDEWVLSKRPKEKQSKIAVKQPKPKKPPPIPKEKPHLEYNPFTGEIKQVQDGIESPFNMGWICSTGNRAIRWEGKEISFARLCWFLSHGEWVKRVAHIDGDKNNHCLNNLKPTDRGN